MKFASGILIAAGAVSLGLTGCEVYEEEAYYPPPRRVAVAPVGPPPPPMYAPGYVTTTLPVGYRTRYYRGEGYYYHDNHYYRRYPRGGYVVVDRPRWW